MTIQLSVPHSSIFWTSADFIRFSSTRRPAASALVISSSLFAIPSWGSAGNHPKSSKKSLSWLFRKENHLIWSEGQFSPAYPLQLKLRLRRSVLCLRWQKRCQAWIWTQCPADCCVTYTSAQCSWVFAAIRLSCSAKWYAPQPQLESHTLARGFWRCGSLRKLLPVAKPSTATTIFVWGSIQIFHRDRTTAGQCLAHEHLPKVTTHAHGNPWYWDSLREIQ